MALLSVVRSPFLTFCQTVLSLLLSTVALLSPYWCEGKQKVPKPLCSPRKKNGCIPVPGLSNSSGGQFSWETGDDRFVFPSFHSGLWTSCEENINLDEWVMLWLSVTMEMMYMGLLSTSCVLLSLQLCVHAWLPSATRWGLLLNAFSAIFTVLAGLLGMVGHMMFMQVFQVTASMGPEDFKPHSYGYSWAFYVAWAAFSVCMSSGVSTLNNYTKNFLMHNFERKSWSFSEEIVQGSSQLPAAPLYCPPPPAIPPPSPPPPPLSPLSPYYSPSCNSASSNFDHLPPPPPLSPYYSPTVHSPSLSLSRSNLSHVPQYSDDGDSL